VDKLIGWLTTVVRPQLVCLSNVLLSGIVAELKHWLPVPIVAMLQGDDIFLEALPEPARTTAIALIRDHCRQIDGFLATCSYYAGFMAEYVGIPRQRIEVVYPGLQLRGHGGPRSERNSEPATIGYFARICPEKGLHHLVEAFRILHDEADAPPCRLRVSGWLGENHRPYLRDLQEKLRAGKLADRFEHLESPDFASKVRFLQSLDILSVPTIYREPKGLYVLEALANGVPVVQPRHGSFPELIEATGGGVLVEPNDPVDLARALGQLLANPAHRAELGRKGKAAVYQRFTAEDMARQTLAVFQKHVR
jgi:glycosyltransferase involved in cell wall biosynthesis